MLGVLFIDGNVTTRRVGGRKSIKELQTRAVINARGFKQKPVGRVEQTRQNFNRGKIARDIRISKRAKNDECGEEKRKDDAHAQQRATCAIGRCALFCESSFAAGAESGECGRHGG